MGTLHFIADGPTQSLLPEQDGTQVRVRAELDGKYLQFIVVRITGQQERLDGLSGHMHRADFWSAVALAGILDQALTARANGVLPLPNPRQAFVIEAPTGLIEHHLRNDVLPAYGDGVVLYSCEDPSG